MLELEKKLLLTQEEYAYLLNEAPKISAVKQTNYYFDTADYLMDKCGITCRIREKDGKYIATIKEHRETGISVERSEQALGEWETHFFDGLGVSLLGMLTTWRTTLLKDARCEIVLDKNNYLGVEDYELEVEYAPGEEAYADALLSSIMQKLSAFFHPLIPLSARGGVGKSKSRRFLTHLKELKRKEKNHENDFGKDCKPA